VAITTTYRIGTKRFTQTESEWQNQPALESAYQKNNQVYCLCRHPNPLLTIKKQTDKYSLEAIESDSLIAHQKGCYFDSKEPHASELKRDDFLDLSTEELRQEFGENWPSQLLWILWVQAQLNVWSPKMKGKRGYKNLVDQIKMASNTIGLDRRKLSEVMDIVGPNHAIGKKPITLGVIKDIQGSRIILKYTNESIIISDEEMEALKLELKTPNVFNDLHVICFVKGDDNRYTLGTLNVNRSFVPVAMGGEDVKMEKRFFVEGSNNKKKIAVPF
jgi:hypothetical protein